MWIYKSNNILSYDNILRFCITMYKSKFSRINKVSNLVYLAPFFSLVFLHFIIHEPIYFTTPAGLLLIIFGIFVQSYKTKPAV